MSIVDFAVSTREARMSPLRSGQPQDQYGLARRCAGPDCEALLSRYNPGETCSLHAGWREPTARRRRRG